MKSAQTFFFAEFDDIKSIIESIEKDFSLNYFETGLLDSNPISKPNSLFEITSSNKINYGDWNLTSRYLLMDKRDSLNVRVIEQIKGGVKYAVDQKENPNSIVFKPSGIFKDGVLVAGSVGTISETDFSKKLYKVFSGLLKKTFTKVGTFYVGSSALNKLNNNWRLVTNEKSPVEYDLKLE